MSSVLDLLWRLDRWEKRSAEEWDQDDCDPLSTIAAENARRILAILNGIPTVELCASRDGGLGIIIARDGVELELFAEPDGEVSAFLGGHPPTDPAR